MSERPGMPDALTVMAGTRLRLKDGAVVEVTENPGDGIWLFCRYLSSPDAGKVGMQDQPVYSEDVAALVE